MKKITNIVVVIAVILALVLCLSACFIGDFTNAYVKIGEEWVDLEIAMYQHYSDGVVRIELLDGTQMEISTKNCILYNGKLPKGVAN